MILFIYPFSLFLFPLVITWVSLRCPPFFFIKVLLELSVELLIQVPIYNTLTSHQSSFETSHCSFCKKSHPIDHPIEYQVVHPVQVPLKLSVEHPTKHPSRLILIYPVVLTVQFQSFNLILGKMDSLGEETLQSLPASFF